MRLNPLRIVNLFNDHKEWIDYEPETLWSEMQETLNRIPGKSVKLARPNKDMIMAVKLCFGSHAPYQEWEVFENVVAALNNETPIIDEVQELFVSEVALAVECMSAIPNNGWSDEVKIYMANIANKDGFILMPKKLSMAQEELNEASKSSDEMVRKVANEWVEQFVKGKKEKIDYEDFVSVHCGKMHDVISYIDLYCNNALKGK